MKKLAVLIIISFISIHTSRAQLFVDTAYTAQQMMEDFFDSTGAVISNVTYSGVNSAIGFYDAGNTNLGINAGILITSGTVFNAVGPNIHQSITGANGSAGDPDLAALAGNTTYDGAVIEFDIVPPSDTLYFKYVWASEEYSEWVGSSFNDVFAFFLDGPGYTNQNIALIPGSSVPVTINNVNCVNGSTDYVCNDPLNAMCPAAYNCPTDPAQTTIEYDGFTTALPIFAIVTAGSTYHVKIAVSDVSDGILDSGVFLSIESLGGNDSLTVDADHIKESNGNEITFHDASMYGSRWFWDFGDGTTSTERNPVHVFADLGNTGYIVKQKVSNFCCSDSLVFGVGNFLGVQNLSDQTLIASPNPVSSVLNIELKNGFGGDIHLYDMTGRVLLSDKISGTTQLNLSAFPSAAYILEYSDGNQVYRQMIQKQ